MDYVLILHVSNSLIRVCSYFKGHVIFLDSNSAYVTIKNDGLVKSPFTHSWCPFWDSWNTLLHSKNAGLTLSI